MLISPQFLNLIKGLAILAGIAFAAGYHIYREDPSHFSRIKIFDNAKAAEYVESKEAVVREPIDPSMRASVDLDWSILYGNDPQRAGIAAAIEEASLTYKLDQNLIRAVIMTESMFDPLAVSGKGARGLMQLMPDTAQQLGVRDIFDTRENILGGSVYLSGLLDEFKGDLPLALAAYNSGSTAVKDAGLKVPFACSAYVSKVLSYYKLFGNKNISSDGRAG